MQRKSLFSSSKVQYSFTTIINALNAPANRLAKDTPIYHLCTDSRSIADPVHSLFFAIKSKSGDGHIYLKECYEKGVRSFVIENQDAIQHIGEDSNYILWNSSLDALQQLAIHHRKNFSIPVIGITGSNGKTIVKEWLSQLLDTWYRICKSPKSYNSQIGVPLSVWQLNEQHTLGIFEAGISMPGEMEKLEKIIEPSIGIFTNIGSAHQANFSTAEEKFTEKMMLFKNTGIIIGNYDLLHDLHRNKIYTWGANERANIQLENIQKSQGSSLLSISIKGEKQKLSIPFTDDASIENIMQCYTVMKWLEIDHKTIQRGISDLLPIEMRLEIKSGINGCTIINDSYNSDAASLRIALDVLHQQKQHKVKTLILSDIFESGKSEENLYSDIAEIILAKGINRFIGIGTAVKQLAKQFPAGKFYNSTEKFLSSLDENDFSNEAILIKGSRKFGFERIAKRLQNKAHSTVMEINLNALIHNLNVYRSYLNPGVKVMAMVKASSYGSGAHEIANTLQHHKVDYLAVAYADEGVYLRQNGLHLPIMVMNPEESAFENISTHQLEPEIYSLKLFKEYALYAKKHGGKNYPIHLKIDSGMHRLGFEEFQVDELISLLKNNPALEVRSIFTHLASTDVPEHDHFTKEQIASFEKMQSKISAALNYPVLLHALNSAGITRFPESQFDMVRLGIGMYGIDPRMEIAQQLEAVSSLKTHISQVKKIPAGVSIGYSRKGIAEKDSVIGTIEIGYADGFPRMLGNGKGKVFVNGKEAPVIGNVCMDMCMIDITGIDAAEGDEVIIFNEDYPVQIMAEAMGTIPYEVLTSISQRVKRVYYKE